MKNKIYGSWAFFLMLQFMGAPRPAVSASWEDEKKAWDEYASQKDYKDPGYAAKLSLNFLPVDNGHFYVGEVGKGIWFSVGQTVSLAAVASAFLGSQSRSKQNKDPIWTTGMAAAAGLGAFGYLGLKVWSAYGAADGARRYNARAAQKQTSLHITPDSLYLTRRF